MNNKEADLAEVKSELSLTLREAEEANNRLTTLKREHHSSCLQLELEKLREMEELRKEFDKEWRWWREDREQETARFTEWKLEITVERDRLREQLDTLAQKRGRFKELGVAESEQQTLEEELPNEPLPMTPVEGRRRGSVHSTASKTDHQPMLTESSEKSV